MGSDAVTKFHQRVHWRAVKRVVAKAMRQAGINKEEYNFDKIRAYEMQGINFMTEDIKTNFTKNWTPLRPSYNYEVYEVPNVSNKKQAEGEFFLLFFNTTTRTYLSAKLIYSLGSQPQFEFLASLEILPVEGTNQIKLRVTCPRKEMVLSDNYSYKFDMLGARKKAYGIITSESVKQPAYRCAEERKAIKIYKKKK